jgi:hypothetical protein
MCESQLLVRLRHGGPLKLFHPSVVRDGTIVDIGPEYATYLDRLSPQLAARIESAGGFYTIPEWPGCYCAPCLPPRRRDRGRRPDRMPDGKMVSDWAAERVKAGATPTELAEEYLALTGKYTTAGAMQKRLYDKRRRARPVKGTQSSPAKSASSRPKATGEKEERPLTGNCPVCGKMRGLLDGGTCSDCI